MTDPADKVAKLLALANHPTAKPDEAENARRFAAQICTKYNIRPAEATRASSRPIRALPGNVQPNWRPAQPSKRWEPPANPFLIAPENNISGISTQDARRMALEILEAQQTGNCYLDWNDEDLLRQAFDGLLTEFGKILLMGLHTVVID